MTNASIAMAAAAGLGWRTLTGDGCGRPAGSAAAGPAQPRAVGAEHDLASPLRQQLKVRRDSKVGAAAPPLYTPLGPLPAAPALPARARGPGRRPALRREASERDRAAEPALLQRDPPEQRVAAAVDLS